VGPTPRIRIFRPLDEPETFPCADCGARYPVEKLCDAGALCPGCCAMCRGLGATDHEHGDAP